MVDTWQPTASNDVISIDKLLELAKVITSQESINEDIEQFSESDINLIASYINAPQASWIKAVEDLSEDHILKLCMIFTRGEMKFSNWTFSSKNPTIYFLRHLKAKNITVEKDFVRWLKKQTDNRYIPYGPAL